MSAFVPSAAALGARRANAPHVPPPQLSSSRATPSFFASSAFGSAMPAARLHHPSNTNTSAPFFSAPRMEVTIVVGDNEPVESALRRFKKDVAKSGHLFELKRRRYFETNTEKRIRKAAAARRKAKLDRNKTKAANRQGGGANVKK